MDSSNLPNLIPRTVDVLNATCCVNMQLRVNQIMEEETGHKTFFLWLPDSEDEAVLQVIGSNVLPEQLHFSVPNQETLKNALDNKGDYSLDSELKRLLSEHLSPFPNNIAKLPIENVDNSGNVSLIFCVIDLQDILVHLELYQTLFRIVTGPLLSTLQLRREREKKQRSQELLRIAKDLFMHLGDLVDLIQEIILKARQLTNAERCSLFLVSDNGTELVAKILDGMPREKWEEIRVPISGSIAGHVAVTGQTLNIRDPYSHELFYRKFDEITGFRTRNILCFPIRDVREHIVGVAQLCNKINGPFFTALDEEAAAALATYCGISLMHSLMYKKIKQSQARVRLANELLMYHMAVTEDSVTEVTRCQKRHDVQRMTDWRWPCREINQDDTACFVLSMYESLGLIDSCRMNRTTVTRFILMAKKGYREIPYHNWMHAFSVVHFAFYIMKELKLVEQSYITELEAVALLTSALCHDLDHRGTTNSFQTKSKNTLACLYSSEGSVMERHHFAQTLCILNTDSCNIFEDLDNADYKRVLDLIRDLILATDLATHFSLIPLLTEVAESYDSSLSDHRLRLLSLIMTAADLSDQIKGWRYTRNIANQIYEEFFAQGDLEKAMGSQPAIMMDRNKADIPTLQVQFLVEICMPCYSLLAQFFPFLKCCVSDVADTLKRWRVAKEWFALPKNEGKSALILLNDPELEKFVFSE